MGIFSNQCVCGYCGEVIKLPLVRTVEHIIPLSKGGNNSQLNKILSCDCCNSWRGNASLFNWKWLVWELISENKTCIRNYRNGSPRVYKNQDLEKVLIGIDKAIAHAARHGMQLYKNADAFKQYKRYNNYHVFLNSSFSTLWERR